MTRAIRPVGHLPRVLALAFGVAVVVGGPSGRGFYEPPESLLRMVIRRC